jgi:hypothetical protein
MPVAVFSVGCVFGTDKFNWPTMVNMILVTIGVAIASFGEAHSWPAMFPLTAPNNVGKPAAATPRQRTDVRHPLPAGHP